MKIRIPIDLALSALMILQMTLPLTGPALHEYAGTVMFLTVVAHQILNARFYRSLARGKYTVQRVVRTAIDCLLNICMILLMVSGIMMSKYAFTFIGFDSGMMAARLVHLCASYWMFVLIGLHIGMHWGMVTGLLPIKKSPAALWAVRTAAAAVAVYGAVCLVKNNIAPYLFLQTQFAFIDYDMNKMLALAETIAKLVFFIFVSYYLLKLSTWCTRRNSYERKK